MKWLPAAVLVLAMLPAAHAQSVPATGITLNVGKPSGTLNEDGADFVPFTGNVSVPVTVRVGCLTLLSNAQSPEVHLEVQAAPEWLVWQDTHVEFPVQEANCDNAGFASKDATFMLAVTASAPGVVKHNVTLTAEIGDQLATANVTIQVQFHADYDIATDAVFPLLVTGGEAHFDVTITNRANARGMVMIEDKAESTGSLGGIGPEVYERADLAKPDVMHFNVTYKAPAAWTDARVTFRAYAHFLVPGYGAGSPRLEKNVEWTFENGSPGGTPTSETGKKSPLPAMPVFGLALLAAALLARRK